MAEPKSAAEVARELADALERSGFPYALGGITPREFLAARHPVGDGSTAAAGPAAY